MAFFIFGFQVSTLLVRIWVSPGLQPDSKIGEWPGKNLKKEQTSSGCLPYFTLCYVPH